MPSSGVIIKSIHYMLEYINCFRALNKMYEPCSCVQAAYWKCGALRGPNPLPRGIWGPLMRTRALFSTFIFLSVKNRKINEHMGPDFNRCSTCTLEKLLTVFRSSVFGTLAVTMVAPSEPLCCFLPFSLPGTVY